MSEPDETETLFIQCLSGHGFALTQPAFISDVAYDCWIKLVKSDGVIMCGEVRVAWHAISFIARGSAAQSFIQAQAPRQAITQLTGMVPQGIA